MKPIPITQANGQRIQELLDATNGAATLHVFAASHLLTLADEAEEEVTRYLLKKEAPGARVRAVSGAPVAKSYDHARRATEVVLERRATGWYLVEVTATKISTFGGGSMTLLLTPEQDRAAVARFRTNYKVMAEPTAQAHPVPGAAVAPAAVH